MIGGDERQGSEAHGRVSRPGARWPLIVLTIGVIVELASLVAQPVRYTIDGGLHLGSAFSLGRLLTGAPGPAQRYLQLDLFPAPNTSPELILAALMQRFDPDAAATILMAGYVVALPLAMVYAIRGIRPESLWIALFALPLTFTFMFEYGFYNFCYATAGFLVIAGFVARHRDGLDRVGVVALGSLLLIVYSMHIVPFIEALLFVGVVTVWDAIADRRAAGSMSSGLGVRVIPVVVASLPSLGLFFLFIARTGVAEPGRYLLPIIPKVVALLSLTMPLATFDTLELAIASWLALIILILGSVVVASRWRAFEVTRADAYLLFAVIGSAAYLVAPSDSPSGGSYILPRLALFPVFGVILWIAAHPLTVRWQVVGAIGALVTAIGLMIVRAPVHSSLARLAHDYVEVAPCMGRQATMIQVNLSNVDAGSLDRTDPMTGEAGRLSSLTDGLDLDNVAASVPFFLIRYRPETDPFRHLQRDLGVYENGFHRIPPAVDLAGYERQTGGTVDYVLVYGRIDAPAETVESADWVTLSSDLEAGYRKVAVSPRHLLEVWERNGSMAAASGVDQRTKPEAAACRISP